MFNRKALIRGRSDIFVSAKAPSPIRARHPELREALVQASLDPAVRSISYVASANVASAPVEIDAVVLARDDGRYHLDVVAARRLRDLEDEGLLQIALWELGLKPFTVTVEDLKAEPRCSNCRLVWSHHRRYVPVSLRIRILHTLRDDGPLELGHLLEGIRADRDPTPSVMSLVCDDLLELDLTSGPLGPSTVVRSRT
jgi:hypothetical protein